MHQRDTDADWRAIGSTEPFWGVLAGDEYRKANLNESAVARFYTSGQVEMAGVVERIRNLFDESFSPLLAIDFGCGVGRLSLAMADYAEHVIGVDISARMLAEAETRRAKYKIESVVFVDKLPEDTVHWVNSYLVFQHIPPERGYGLLAELLSRLAPGGVASIHLTTHRDKQHLPPSLDDIGLCRFDGQVLEVISQASDTSVGRMRMYDYDLGRVLPTFIAAGIERMWLEHLDHAGHHAFWVLGRKGWTTLRTANALRGLLVQ
jgi:SAM-dependent methyltransferase